MRFLLISYFENDDLVHMRAAERGLRRLDVALDKTGPKTADTSAPLPEAAVAYPGGQSANVASDCACARSSRAGKGRRTAEPGKDTVLYSRVSDDFLSGQESLCELPPFC
jgi:hypothetical protein